MTKEAKPNTWMPLVIGDYLKDTGRLTTEQHGAYLLLIMEYWMSGPPPDDDEELAAITRLDTKSWRRNRPKLVRFFRIEDGVWRHKRIDRELDEWTERKRRYASRASAGGRGKAAKSTASSTASSTKQASKNGTKSVLKGCSPSISSEVEGPKEPSTLRGRERPEARADGASRLRVVKGGHDEAEAWREVLAQARIDLPHFEQEDPDFASEIAEFIALAEARLGATEVAA